MNDHLGLTSFLLSSYIHYLRDRKCVYSGLFVSWRIERNISNRCKIEKILIQTRLIIKVQLNSFCFIIKLIFIVFLCDQVPTLRNSQSIEKHTHTHTYTRTHTDKSSGHLVKHQGRNVQSIFLNNKFIFYWCSIFQHTE